MNIKTFCVFLDAGHGGLNPKLKVPNNYTTYPSKCWQHKNSLFYGYGWFFEGVFNRAVTVLIEKYLKDWGFTVINVYDPVLDLALGQRVKKANFASSSFSGSLYLSIHGNAAASLDARGFEVYTSPSQTQSDIMASFLFDEVRETFPNWIFRTDTTDGDSDREARFYVLTQTTMPSVLSENGFFTNYKDALMMFDPVFQDNLALCHARAVVDYVKNLGYVF